MLKMVGFIILYLIYGNEEYNKKFLPPSQFTVALQLAISAAFVFWLMTIMMTFGGKPGTKPPLSAIAYDILFPFAIIMWALIVRITAKKD